MAEAGGGEHLGIEQPGIEPPLVPPRRPRHPMGETAAGGAAMEIDVLAVPGIGVGAQRLSQQPDFVGGIVRPQHPHPPAKRAIALGDGLGRVGEFELDCTAVAGEGGIVRECHGTSCCRGNFLAHLLRAFLARGAFTILSCTISAHILCLESFA